MTLMGQLLVHIVWLSKRKPNQTACCYSNNSHFLWPGYKQAPPHLLAVVCQWCDN